MEIREIILLVVMLVYLPVTIIAINIFSKKYNAGEITAPRRTLCIYLTILIPLIGLVIAGLLNKKAIS